MGVMANLSEAEMTVKNQNAVMAISNTPIKAVETKGASKKTKLIRQAPITSDH